MKPRSSSSTSGTQQHHFSLPHQTHRPSVGARIYKLLGVSDSFDNAHAYVTSPILSAPILATVRLTLALYTLVALVFALSWDAERLHTAKSFFSYFTELSYIGLCSYFWASGVQTLAYVRQGRTSYPLQHWPRVLQVLHILLHATVIVFPFIVTIVFWGVLNPDSPVQDDSFDIWSAATFHSMNALFATFEITCTNAPPSPWLLAPILVTIMAGYLGVAYITHATQGFYTYSFLDPQEHGSGRVVAYVFGIAIGTVVLFTIVRTLCQVRIWGVRRWGCGRADSNVREDMGVGREREELDEWNMVEV